MKVVLGVCGSISCYKALDMTRELTKKGHEVRVVLTHGAENFLRHEVFHYLGASKVYRAKDDFKFPNNVQEESYNVLHIELAHWADTVVIAPLSAHTAARLSQGLCDDLLGSIFLALPGNTPISLFPAMNHQMLNNPLTQSNFARLESLNNVTIHPTKRGEQACGMEGEGKLLDVDHIIELILSTPLKRKQEKKHYLITTGATLSPLDPVRYLTNASSGITGHYLAREALARGHQVTVIAGKNATKKLSYFESLPDYRLIKVVTTSEMSEVITELFPQCDIYISAAAIGDIEFETSPDKIKKQHMGTALPYKKTKDILAHCLDQRRPEQKLIGFAAETDLTEDMLLKKWKQKPVDLLVGTQVHNGLVDGKEQAGFTQEFASYQFLKNGKVSEQKLSKEQLATTILSQ